jgi:dTDP-4-amino-4,6-dideoxy-D-glucose acyltransferase
MKSFNLLCLLKEQFWGFIEVIIIFFPNPLGSRLRFLYWKLRLKSLGQNVLFGVGVRITNPQNVTIGNHCWIDDYAIIIAGPPKGDGRSIIRKNNPDYQLQEGEIYIGNHVHIAQFVILQGHGGIFIGDSLTIAAGSKLYSFIHHYENGIRGEVIYKFVGLVPPEEQTLICSPIVIHNYSAVGLNSVILPGSTIGENSWLGAQSLLKGVLADNVIAYGNPAKKKKNRFTQ